MKLNNDCRKLIPCIEFKADDNNATQGGPFDLASFYAREYLHVALDEHKAQKFSNCFKKPNFEELVEEVASVVSDHSCAEGVYLLQTVEDKIHLRFYISEHGVEKFREAVGDPNLEVDESLGCVWVLSYEQFVAESMLNYLVDYCETIVDLDTLSVWEVNPRHYTIPPKPNFFLPDPVSFTHGDYVSAYDQYSGTPGDFKISSRGLRLYDPVLGMFVKFNRKGAVVKTTANTLLFRQSYNSYYYLFDIDLSTNEVKNRHYKSAESLLIDVFSDKYGSMSRQDFQITGNE